MSSSRTLLLCFSRSSTWSKRWSPERRLSRWVSLLHSRSIETMFTRWSAKHSRYFISQRSSWVQLPRRTYQTLYKRYPITSPILLPTNERAVLSLMPAMSAKPLLSVVLFSFLFPFHFPFLSGFFFLAFHFQFFCSVLVFRFHFPLIFWCFFFFYFSFQVFHFHFLFFLFFSFFISSVYVFSFFRFQVFSISSFSFFGFCPSL